MSYSAPRTLTIIKRAASTIRRTGTEPNPPPTRLPARRRLPRRRSQRSRVGTRGSSGALLMEDRSEISGPTSGLPLIGEATRRRIDRPALNARGER